MAIATVLLVDEASWALVSARYPPFLAYAVRSASPLSLLGAFSNHHFNSSEELAYSADQLLDVYFGRQVDAADKVVGETEYGILVFLNYDCCNVLR